MDSSAGNVPERDDSTRQDLAPTVGTHKVINASEWGCVSGTDITVPLQAAANEADSRGYPLVMDIPEAIVTGDLQLPQFFDGGNCVFTGIHNFVVRRRKHARIHSFTCSNLLVSGAWHCDLDNINVVNRWSIDGCEAQWGTFWNTFRNIRCGQIYLNVKFQAVNQNSFKQCLGTNPAVFGVLITDEGAAASDGVMEAHNNIFEGCDVSHSGGFYNDVAVRKQFNTILGGYAEHGAQIIGPWTTIGCNIDGASPPLVTARNHVIAQTDHSSATMGDSFSTSPANLAIGGDWLSLDKDGKPPSFSASFSATVQPTVVPTNWGYPARYGGTVTGSFQTLSVNFISSTEKFSAVIYMEFPTGELPVVIIVDNGSTQSYRTPGDCSNEGHGRYLYRISGECIPGVNCAIQFLLTGATAATRTAFIGAAFVTANKAAMMPMFPGARLVETSFVNGAETKRGEISQSYVSGNPYFDIKITYGAPFSASVIGNPSLSFMPSVPYRGNFSKYEILTATITGFDARIYYTGEWSGEIFWRA